MRLLMILAATVLLSGCLETTGTASNAGPGLTPEYRLGRVLVFGGRYETSDRQEAAFAVVDRLRGHHVDAVDSGDLERPAGERLSRSGRLQLARQNGFDSVLVITNGSERTQKATGPIAGFVFFLPSSRPTQVATLYDSIAETVVWTGQFRTRNDPSWPVAKVKYDTAEAIVQDMRERGLLGPRP
ncbi:hypothetical protein [Thalassobaculum sp.]|uniref:hypothetical protein n=1 Tax=Thalassobaculum sp. TaxID=2022740 RepID=UPI0032ED7A56